MRPVTKVILVLSLIALAVVVLYLSARKWGSGGADKPAPVTAERSEPRTPEYNDPLATYQRWRTRLTGPEGSPASPSPGQSSPPARPFPRELDTTSRNEGTIVAHRLEEPVAGADPPGPVLRPSGIVGEIISGRLRSPAAAENVHTVVQGDTLYGIALRHYGDPRYIQAIQAANPGLDADRLRVGDKIRLPDVKRDERAAASSTAPTAPTPKVYIVQKNDTLIGIARRVYGDAAMYPRIYEANKDVLSSPNARLYVGQRLRLPEPPQSR